MFVLLNLLLDFFKTSYYPNNHQLAECGIDTDSQLGYNQTKAT